MSFGVYGQLDISHYTYDSKDGLNAAHVYGIVQDSEGTIWIGTSSGLLEFNGVNFKEVDLPGLKNIEVFQLKIDKDDTIWFVNLSNQLCKYSRAEGFNSVELLDDKGHTETWLTDSLVGVYGNIAIGKVFNKQTLKLVTTKENRFYFIRNDKIISQDSNNKLLLSDSDRNYNIEIQDYRSYHLVNYLSIFDKDYVLFNNKKNLYELVKGTNEYTLKKIHISDIPHLINNVTVISDSLIHFNTSIGVFAYDANKNVLQHYHKGINCTNSILDNENNLWVSTMNNGIFFSHFSEISSIKHYENSSISEMYPLNDELWIGTQTGELSYLVKTMEGKLINLSNEDGPVRFIIGNSKNQLVFAQNSKLLLFDKNEEHLVKLENKPTMPLCHKKASFISTNLIAVGTCSSTSIYDINQNGKILKHILPTGRVYSILYEKLDSSLLISSIKGLFKYDSNLNSQPFLNELLPNNITIIHLERASNNILWIVSNNAGIYGIYKNQIKYHFDKDHLLNTNSVNDLYISKNNELWVSTTSGVNVIDSSYTKSSFITQKDGLLSNIVHKVTHWNDEVYVGTSKGLNVFNHNATFYNNTAPPIYLDQVIVDGEFNDLSELTGKEVNYRFTFRGINFSSLGDFQYKYRMKGLSDSWEFVTSDVEEIVYNKLPPNDYSFEIYAINEDGLESIEPASISFSVPGPFYQRWWFYLLALLLSIGIISAIFQYRIRQIKRKNKIEQEIRSHQLTALKAQMKPHFISNILNSIQSHSMLRDPLMVNSYITRLSSFVRKVLKMSDAETVSLESELDVLKTYIELELLRSDNAFDYDIEIDPSINMRGYFIPPMLIQPYVENAIKHGMRGKTGDHLKLRLRQNDKGILVVSIIDNGPGIQKSKKIQPNSNGHISLGSEINSDRIKLLRLTYKQTFSVKTIDLKGIDNTSGTQIELEIPNILK